MNKKIIITIITLMAVVLLGIKGKGLLETRKTEVAKEPLPLVEKVSVSVVKAKQGVLKHTEAYLAQLHADKSITLSTKLAGYVQKVYVEASQVVKKGDVLVHIDALELQSNILSLKATLQAQEGDVALAKSVASRNQKLYVAGGLSKEKLEFSNVSLHAKESLLESTKQKIAQLEHQLSYLKIVAPFDGTIDTVMMHEGDLAAVGKPILSMSNSKQKLVFSYAPSRRNLVMKGQKVFLDTEEIGMVKSIYNTTKNGLITAEIALHATIDLPIGANIRIGVLTQEQEGCLVPTNSLLHKKEGSFVMAYQEGHFSPMAVNVQMQEGNRAIVSPCPHVPIAQASEVKLSTLPAYSHVEILGVGDE